MGENNRRKRDHQQVGLAVLDMGQCFGKAIRVFDHSTARSAMCKYGLQL